MQSLCRFSCLLPPPSSCVLFLSPTKPHSLPYSYSYSNSLLSKFSLSSSLSSHQYLHDILNKNSLSVYSKFSRLSTAAFIFMSHPTLWAPWSSFNNANVEGETFSSPYFLQSRGQYRIITARNNHYCDLHANTADWRKCATIIKSLLRE